MWNSQLQCYSGLRTPTCALYSVQNAESLAWWFLFNKMAWAAQFETIILAWAWTLWGYDVCLVYDVGLKRPQVCIAENSQMSHGIMSWSSALSSTRNPFTGQIPDWTLLANYRSNCPDWKGGRVSAKAQGVMEGSGLAAEVEHVRHLLWRRSGEEGHFALTIGHISAMKVNFWESSYSGDQYLRTIIEGPRSELLGTKLYNMNDLRQREVGAEFPFKSMFSGRFLSHQRSGQSSPMKWIFERQSLSFICV